MSSEYPHGTYVPPIVNAPRSERSQEALDEELPIDEQLEAAGILPPRMGRPSQGREKRLQATVTPEVMTWLEEQKARHGDKSVSDVVFRLLESLRQQEK